MGKPRVNYLEAITQRVQFDYLHKKQSGVCILLCFAAHPREMSRQVLARSEVLVRLLF